MASLPCDLLADAQRVWCLGGVAASQRAMTDDERRYLERALRERWRGVGGVAFVVAFAVLSLVLSRDARFALRGPATLVLMVHVTWAVSGLLASTSARRALTRARGATSVVRFVAPLDAASWPLLDRLPGSPRAPREIELLMPGALLWRVDGDAPSAWVTLSVLSPTRIEEFAATSSARPLSAVEREELRRWCGPSRTLRVVGVRAALALCRVALLGAACWGPQGSGLLAVLRDEGAAGRLFDVAASLCVVWAWRGWRDLAAMRGDLARGVALRSTSGASGVYRADLGDARERLPSGLAWTERGRPASWRRFVEV